MGVALDTAALAQPRRQPFGEMARPCRTARGRAYLLPPSLVTPLNRLSRVPSSRCAAGTCLTYLRTDGSAAAPVERRLFNKDIGERRDRDRDEAADSWAGCLDRYPMRHVKRERNSSEELHHVGS